MPFILLLLALFTIAGGIVVAGNIHGSPAMNTALLAIGTGLASLIGTTGASMVMIRPIMRANDNRRHNTHVVVFFIFLVSNIGGSLTPLGDPPLFLGFLRGVDFFWTTTHLLSRDAVRRRHRCSALFFLLDTRSLPQGGRSRPRTRRRTRKSACAAARESALIGVVIAAILMSAAWKPGVSFTIHGVTIELQNALRDLTMVVATLVSLALTRRRVPGGERVFLGADQGGGEALRRHLLVMMPVLAMLRAGAQGAFAPLVALVTQPGRLAEQRRLFLAHGRAVVVPRQRPDLSGLFRTGRRRCRKHLMTAGALTLAAISCGRGVHGGEHLHRQRAELHGLRHRPQARRQDAELLRLHAVVGRGADPGVHPGDVRVLPLRGAPADGAAYGLGLTARVQHPSRLLRAVSLIFPGFRGDPAGRRAAGRRRTAIRKRT